MTRSTTQIGSGRPLFVLPGDRFINSDKPLSRQSDLNANNPVKAAMTRLYRYRNGLLEAAWADDPDRWSVLLLPSLLSMTPEELRHVAGVIEEGRAKMEAGGD